MTFPISGLSCSIAIRGYAHRRSEASASPPASSWPKPFWTRSPRNVGSIPSNFGQRFGPTPINDGNVELTNFSDYPVPRMRDTPAMHVELIPSDNPPVGVGQTSVPLVAPAIGNAVAQLTDIRLRQLPMSPERVKTALG